MSSNGYDSRQVQKWINEIEEALDTPLDEYTVEGEEIIGSIRNHYIEAQERIMDEGLSEEASYEIEVAYNRLDDLKYAENLVKDLPEDTDI